MQFSVYLFPFIAAGVQPQGSIGHVLLNSHSFHFYVWSDVPIFKFMCLLSSTRLPFLSTVLFGEHTRHFWESHGQ